jgi:hypothetical protein
MNLPSHVYQDGIVLAIYNALTAFVDFRLPPAMQFASRRKLITVGIQKHSADGLGPHLIGLVEVNVPMLRALLDDMPQYKAVGMATMVDIPIDMLTETDFIGELNVILYRHDLGIAVNEVDRRWYSETPTEPCSKSWNTRYARGCFAAEFKVHCKDTEPRQIWYFLSHYDDGSQEARAASVSVESSLVKSKSAKCAPNAIIYDAGDRNPFPDAGGNELTSALERELGEVGLKFVKSADKHYGPPGTFPGVRYVEDSGRSFTDRFAIKQGEIPMHALDAAYSNQVPRCTIHDANFADGCTFDSANLIAGSDHCLVVAIFDAC